MLFFYLFTEKRTTEIKKISPHATFEMCSSSIFIVFSNMKLYLWSLLVYEYIFFYHKKFNFFKEIIETKFKKEKKKKETLILYSSSSPSL